MIDSLLRDCDFTGYYWNEIKPLLGDPFAQRSYGKETTYYKYRVSWFPESYYDTPGNVFLMVDVINDTITWFKSLEIDG